MRIPFYHARAPPALDEREGDMFRQRDDLDRAPPRDALPDWRAAGGQARPAPPWLWPAALLGLALLLGALLALLYPFITLAYDLTRDALTAYAVEARAVVGLALLLGLAALVAALWRAVGLLGALVARVRVIRAPGDTPLDVGALQAPGWGKLAGDALAAHYGVQATWAAQSGYRNLHTYAPHVVCREGPRAPPAPPAAPPLPAAPSVRQLLDAGDVGRGRPLLLGIDAATGEPIRGSFKSLYSTGIGGLQGSGKTWAAALLLAQSAAHGARLVLCDPHAGDSESLAARCAGLAPAFLCEPARIPSDILAALRLAHDELQRRKAGAPERWPLIVAIDEWTSLLRGELGDDVPRLVEAFTTEGRKLNIHAMPMAQRWDKPAAGALRNTLASAYAFRLRPDEVRMLTGLRAASLPNDTLTLPPGSAYLMTTAGELRKVVIPVMTEADVSALGVQATHPATNGAPPPRVFGFRPPPAEVARKPAGSRPESKPESKPEVISAASQRPVLDPEAARIVALFLAGKDIPAIIAEVYGSTGGRAYQEKRVLVERMLRDALKRGN